MTLSTIYKIFGSLHVVMGVVMLGGLAPLPVGWAASVGLTTMAEHFGSAMMVIGFMFWMLPSWTSDEQLKSATMPLIWAQLFLILMPIYHVINGSIALDAMFYANVIILLALVWLFYSKSRS